MERGGNLGRLEIQFKTDRVLVVRTFSLSEFSTKAIETTETEINRERERAHKRDRLDPRSSLRRNDTR